MKVPKSGFRTFVIVYALIVGLLAGVVTWMMNIERQNLQDALRPAGRAASGLLLDT